ncbi:hypothetical protein MSHOH_1188 [Methanosarcina horonobensis HB-1 = JCM 15518]|uniref:Uncharacterized protein n=2 Tax=Methanosarcina horonobensis TaxID=418008 RepID=A0A0E3SA80_9EURY|nr:hypothetical protein [Methanosarcina horonobensis]AKB77671.1 hypothetical protein MSHOH_1188 [Methanosarcina horonobensis HB-1 = JCM 15518]
MVSYSKNRILGLFLVLLLLASITGIASCVGDITEASTFTTSVNSSAENDLFSELSAQMELYNENFDNVPSLVKRLVGSEEIAGKIELNNGEMLYVTLLMNGGKVGDFYRYDTPNDPNSKFGPSITVESDEETVREILDSDDRLRKAVEEMNDGSLNVEVEGYFRKTVFWSIKQLYS